MFLPLADLAACFRVLGHHVPELTVRSLFEEFSVAGKMPLEGFLKAYRSHTSDVKRPEAMIQAFQIFDPDNRGYLSSSDFRIVMGRTGEKPLAPDVVDKMLAWADPEDIGQVDYVAFTKRLFSELEAHKKSQEATKAKLK